MSPELELALLHVPERVRGPLRALFAIDDAMGDVVIRSTESALGRIKLAWWREQLQALDENPPPAEPRLEAVAEQLLPRGISGDQVSGLEPGWATLLDPEVDPKLVAERGALLFRLGGRLLGADDARLADAGALYTLSTVGRRGVPELLELAKAYRDRLRGHRFERRLRPLTMLARAAARGTGRGQALSMLAHRWSGRIG